MAKYTFKYESEEFGKTITHEIDYSSLTEEENLPKILKEFVSFLQAITYEVKGLISTNYYIEDWNRINN